MQGKEQKQPHEREADQNKNRLEDKISRPPQQHEPAIAAGSELDTELERDGVEVEREEMDRASITRMKSEESSDDEDTVSEREQQQQEQAILDQWETILPTSDRAEFPSTEEDQRAETDKGEPESDQCAPIIEDKQEPAGRLIWKKGEGASAGEGTIPAGSGQLQQEQAAETSEEVNTFQVAPALSQEIAPKSEIDEEPERKRGIRTGWKVLLYLFLGLPVLAAVALIGGLLIGYSVVGEDSAGEIFSRDLWQHLYDLIYG
ncbi:DNA-directed RNA polymerase subunit beta [Desmospora activa]|uniref:DNA-directed RNA polymerase subunit beta n=1 Tax=Desmospora activa DSM 45169 TaxID=1121389 RepID=A0A2T4Z4A4_9BACL|nr:DNA-directed RNA polymerase subunit beta [Desmospora activa]PTM56731.1 DNA-directed RNA polymerase subunit beta [Desmospora activa DSM 45169]